MIVHCRDFSHSTKVFCLILLLLYSYSTFSRPVSGGLQDNAKYSGDGFSATAGVFQQPSHHPSQIQKVSETSSRPESGDIHIGFIPGPNDPSSFKPNDDHRPDESASGTPLIAAASPTLNTAASSADPDTVAAATTAGFRSRPEGESTSPHTPAHAANVESAKLARWPVGDERPLESFQPMPDEEPSLRLGKTRLQSVSRCLGLVCKMKDWTRKYREDSKSGSGKFWQAEREHEGGARMAPAAENPVAFAEPSSIG